MPRDRLRVTSNFSQLDPALFLHGFAAFLTGAVCDGSFVITLREETAAPQTSAEPLTEQRSTATLRMTGDGQKGAYE